MVHDPPSPQTPPPAALLSPLTLRDLRCPRCKRLLANAVTPPFRLWCRSCKEYVERQMAGLD